MFETKVRCSIASTLNCLFFFEDRLKIPVSTLLYICKIAIFNQLRCLKFDRTSSPLQTRRWRNSWPLWPCRNVQGRAWGRSLQDLLGSNQQIKSSGHTPTHPDLRRRPGLMYSLIHVLKSMHSNYFLWKMCILFIWEGLLVYTKVCRPCIFKISWLIVVLLSIFERERREKYSLHTNISEPHSSKYIIECAQLNHILYMTHYEECICQNALNTKKTYNKLLRCIVNKKALRSVVLNLVVSLFRYLRLIAPSITHVEKYMLYTG